MADLMDELVNWTPTIFIMMNWDTHNLHQLFIMEEIGTLAICFTSIRNIPGYLPAYHS